MSSESMGSKSEESMPGEGHEEMMTLAGYACPMHPEETSLEPGTCGICGMALEPARLHYVCPMHPEETSLEPGKCPVCGMALVLRPVGKEPEQGGMGH
jgi:Cu(I)/Ag(I) efflux system membrane fusion protein